MWQERQAELLKEEIETILAPASGADRFHDLLKEPLTKIRRGLAPKNASDRPWSLLPLIVCEVICGTYDHALPAAAGLQFLMAAGDIFDDIEDADSIDSVPASSSEQRRVGDRSLICVACFYRRKRGSTGDGPRQRGRTRVP